MMLNLLKENGKVEVKQELKELSSSALPSLACSDISRHYRRGVAQPGRALSSGGRGRWFESTLPDQKEGLLDT